MGYFSSLCTLLYIFYIASYLLFDLCKVPPDPLLHHDQPLPVSKLISSHVHRLMVVYV